MTVSPVEWYDNTFLRIICLLLNTVYQKYGQYCCKIRSIIADLLSQWDGVNFIFIDIYVMRIAS